jgi:hypothetical protein
MIREAPITSPFVNNLHVGLTVDRGTHPKTAAFVTAMHARPSSHG